MHCSAQKVYIGVTADIDPDGEVFPRSFIWEDGNSYEIGKIIDMRPAESLNAGGAGRRFTIRVGNKVSYLFMEENRGVIRWFMEQSGN